MIAYVKKNPTQTDKREGNAVVTSRVSSDSNSRQCNEPVMKEDETIKIQLLLNLERIKQK